jgi:cytochrome c peroxidase
MQPRSLSSLALFRLLLCSTVALCSMAYAMTPTEQLAAYSVQAGVAAQPARGQQLFTAKHGKDWSCASCHTASPTVEGKHASTGKVIAPLAPAFNPDRFTDTAKTDKWFRRNCNDVMGRECTAGEKADVLAWLLTLKR